jgi:pyruvate/2-oxoglutarate dehydrogenase complex dihydrolipoamide acyltransferase (E2) component
VRKNQVESHKDRKALAREAGLGSISWISIFAGTLAAYGLTAVLLAIAGGVAAVVNSGTNFSNVSWTDLKAGTGIIVGVILFVSYLFGGYVAGRMARRSGHANGLGVFVVGVLLALGVGVWVKAAGGTSGITTTLRNIGAPTTWHEWRDVGTVAGVAALAGMLIGSLLGGIAGERWHSKLLARALDPNFGPEAEQRAAAERAAAAEAAAAEQRAAAERAAEEERQAAAVRQAERRAAAERQAAERQTAERPPALEPRPTETREPAAAELGTPDGHTTATAGSEHDPASATAPADGNGEGRGHRRGRLLGSKGR